MAVLPATYTATIATPPRSIEVKHVKSSEGRIRIWRKAGSVARSASDDFMASGTSYNLAQLNITGKLGTLYVEGINASSAWGATRIKVAASADGGRSWPLEDAVRVTCIRSNFTVGVVRRFYREHNFIFGTTSRCLFVPDYSTPKRALEVLYHADVEETKTRDRNYPPERDLGDPWWHEPDALDGHGFAFFQYEGPPLAGADTMRSKCKDSPYDSSYYFGKTGTGGPTPWNYGDAPEYSRRNEQGELVWWHYCPPDQYKIQDEPLVLMRTWTLNPWRMSSMFRLFDQDDRYLKFGLHIDRSIKGSSCLSNVGLVLVESHFMGFTGPKTSPSSWKWHFNQVLPSTINKSVWTLLAGVERCPDVTGKGRLELMDDVVDIIIEETEGLNWGQQKFIADETDPNSMVSKLFNVLRGKTIRYPDGTSVLIETKGDLRLNHSSTDTLEYFDPGLVPADFPDNPTDLVDFTPPAP
jgi:hypothetical protein